MRERSFQFFELLGWPMHFDTGDEVWRNARARKLRLTL